MVIVPYDSELSALREALSKSVLTLLPTQPENSLTSHGDVKGAIAITFCKARKKETETFSALAGEFFLINATSQIETARSL